MSVSGNNVITAIADIYRSKGQHFKIEHPVLQKILNFLNAISDSDSGKLFENKE